MKNSAYGWSLLPDAYGVWRKKSDGDADNAAPTDTDNGNNETDTRLTDSVATAVMSVTDKLEAVTDATDRMTLKMVSMSVSIFAFVGVLIGLLSVIRHLVFAINDQLTDIAEQTILMGVSVGTCLITAIIVMILYFIFRALIWGDSKSY